MVSDFNYVYGFGHNMPHGDGMKNEKDEREHSEAMVLVRLNASDGQARMPGSLLRRQRANNRHTRPTPTTKGV